MAEEYKNASEEFKNVQEHETPKITTTEEPSSETTGEVKDRGLFDFLGKKDEVKPHETKAPLEPDFEHKTQISEEEKEKEHKPSLLEKLHGEKEEEENKPSLLQKLHRSNSSSSSSSEEEGEDGEKRKKKKEKKKIVEGEEEEKKGLMEKIKEKLPGHGTKTEDGAHVVTAAPVEPAPTPVAEEAPEKKGFLEKIKEKLPGHHSKEDEKIKEKETHDD